MEQKNPKQVLTESFCIVAENLAFMFGELAEDGPVPAPDRRVMASMRFTGPYGGAIEIAVPFEMCAEIAANVLGVDPDDERISVDPLDALKELLNVTCGHVLTSLAGDEPVFDLTVPETSDMNKQQWTAMTENPETVAFLVDENPVLMRLILDPR